MVNVDPSNINEWFQSYTTYITSLATLSERMGVDVLSVALELELISGKYHEEWVRMIRAVRERFTGLLTYCSVFWPIETQNITFWDELDFISMDTYLPLWDGISPFPSQDAMTEMYIGYLEGVDDWHKSQSERVSRLPIVLSEVGYPSTLEGLITPWLSSPTNTCTGNWSPNTTAQQMAFQAVVTAITSTDVVQGFAIFWFDNPSSPDFCGDRANNTWSCSWDVRGKPAEKVIAEAFCGVVDSTCV